MYDSKNLALIDPENLKITKQIEIESPYELNRSDFSLIKDISSGSLAVFQKDTLRMINDDLKLSEPIKLKQVSRYCHSFMHLGRIYMNHHDTGKCDIFSDEGQLIEQVQAKVLLPLSDRLQYYLVDTETNTLQFRDREPINMLRNRIFDKQIKYMSNIDP